MSSPNSPFMASVAAHLRVRRYSERTIKTYLYWIRYYIVYHNKQHPNELDGQHVEQFLSFLANNRHVAAATQKIALNALVFLYNRFLEQPLGDVSGFRRSRHQPKLPVVLTRLEIVKLLAEMRGVHHLLASMLYGSGLRRIEAVRLRVNDVDLDLGQLRIWNGKGFKHRITALAPELSAALKHQIQQVNLYLQADLEDPRFAGVYLPDALARKYNSAGKSAGWQYLFPSRQLSQQTGTGLWRRHYLDGSSVNKAIRHRRHCAPALPNR